MKITLFTLIAFLSLCTNLFSQNTFEKRYPISKDVWAKNIAQDNDSNFYIVGSEWTNERTYNLIKLSSNGDTLWRKIINPNDSMDYASFGIVKGIDNGIILYGALNNSSNHDAFLRKYNSNGSIDWSYTENYLTIRNIEAGDSTYLLTSYSFSQTLIEFSKTGVKKQFKSRTQLGDITYFHIAKKINSSGYLLATKTNVNSGVLAIALLNVNNLLDTVSSNLVVLDSTYNYIIDSDFKATTDGGSIMLLRIEKMDGTRYIALYKFKTDLTLDWICKLNVNNENLDQTGEVVEYSGNYYVNTTLDYYMNFIKVSNSGIVQWKRIYSGANVGAMGIGTSYGVSITSTLDNGFVLYGSVSVSGKLDSYVVKTDVNGLVGISSKETNLENILIYPNPAVNEIDIVLNKTGENSVIYITSIEGNIIKTFYNQKKSCKINISDLSSGIYIVNVINLSGTSYRQKLVKE